METRKSTPLPETITRPAENPKIRAAQRHLMDARQALERPLDSQARLEDAIRSAEHFMSLARAKLKELP